MRCVGSKPKRIRVKQNPKCLNRETSDVDWSKSHKSDEEVTSGMIESGETYILSSSSEILDIQSIEQCVVETHVWNNNQECIYVCVQVYV